MSILRRLPFTFAVLLLGAVGLDAGAALPFEIELSDLDGNSVIDGDDLPLAVDQCGAAYFEGGCTIVLPRQTIGMTSTWLIGGSSYPSGIIFRGQGSCSAAVSPPLYSEGTVLRWDGPNLGTMVEIQRGYRLRFENLCLVMDPDMSTGGNAARYGVHFNGDPAAGAMTQGVVFENVAIWGPTSGTPPVGMTGVYITATGAPKTGQNDKMRFEDCYIRGVDIGVHQDALQSLLNVYDGGELVGQTHALEVTAGNFDLRNVVVGCLGSGCIVLDLGFQLNAGPQETLISSIFWEADHPATFLRLGQGWSSSNTTYGQQSPVVVENSYLTNQRNGPPGGCNNVMLDAAEETMVVFRGNHIYATGDPELDCGFDLKASNPETRSLGTIYWNENNIRAPIPISVVLTGGNVKLLAISIDRTGAVFNDVNLNRFRDPGENTL